MHNLQPCEPQIQANLKECKYEPFALPSQKHANARLHFHIANMRMRVYTAAPQAFEFCPPSRSGKALFFKD